MRASIELTSAPGGPVAAIRAGTRRSNPVTSPRSPRRPPGAIRPCAVEDLGRAHPRREFQAARPRGARPAAHPDDEAGPAYLRGDARCRLRGAEGGQPREPRHRGGNDHHRRHLGARLDQAPPPTQRQAAAAGPLRPQPVHLADTEPPRPADRPRVRRLLRPRRLAGWVDRWLARGGGNRKRKLFLAEFSALPTTPTSNSTSGSRKPQAKWTGGLADRRRRSRIYALGWYSLYTTSPDPKGRGQPGVPPTPASASLPTTLTATAKP